MRRWLLLFSLAPSVAALWSCGSTHTPSDSETHFLVSCTETCERGLRCVCGVCTEACDDGFDCGALSPGATCQTASASDGTACTDEDLPAQVCELECLDNDSCKSLSSAHVCYRGRCRTPPRDDRCSLPVEQGPTLCNAALRVYSFIATHGRCEEVSYGGCGATANNYAAPEACWDACETANDETCFEAWRPVGVNTSPRGALLFLIEGTHEADMRFPDGSTTRLSFTVSEADVYRVTAANNPEGGSFGQPSECADRYVVEANARFVTDDGRFDETWERIAFEVPDAQSVDPHAQTIVALQAPGASATHGRPLRGEYVPDVAQLAGDRCEAWLSVSIAIAREEFGGEVATGFFPPDCGAPANVPFWPAPAP